MKHLCLPAFSLSLLLTACGPAAPTLASMVAPALTVQRLPGAQLQAILTYDTARTACGEVPNLKVTFDGQPLNASAGRFDAEAMTEVERCQFPGFVLSPEAKTTPRSIVFTDDVTTFTMTVSTLEPGAALADSPPPTIRSATPLRWLTTLPTDGTRSYQVAFTPEGGAAAVWAEGTALGSSLSVVTPVQTKSASGEVTLSWFINAALTACEGGLVACDAVVQGRVSYKAVVSP